MRPAARGSSSSLSQEFARAFSRCREFVGRTRSIASDLVEDLIERTIQITESSAPTNEEAGRANLVHHMFTAAGFDDVRIDNLSKRYCANRRDGTDPGPC